MFFIIMLNSVISVTDNPAAIFCIMPLVGIITTAAVLRFYGIERIMLLGCDLSASE